jgi:hypothetical protein
VAHWRFDEAGGPTAYDESVNNNDGTLNAGTGGSNTSAGQMWYYPGKFGGAMEFDGVDDYVDAGDKASLDFAAGQDFTAECWVKTSATGGIILAKGGTGDATKGYWLYGAANGTFEAGLTDGVGSRVLGTSTSTINDGAWHHVVAVYDRDANCTIYVDGKVDGSPFAISAEGDLSNANPFTVGRRSDTASQYFNGLIDDVRIYNYARSAEQIMVDYNAGAAAHLGAGVSSLEGTPPVGWWQLDENTGTTVYDRSGNNNNGTFTGSPSWTFGKYGSAVDCGNTTGDYINVPNVDLPAAWTISAWFKMPLTSTGSSWHTLTRGNGGDHQIIVTRSTMELGTYDNVGATGFHGSGYYINSLGDGWHHIAAVGSGGSTVFYIDGQKVGTSNFQSTTDVRSIGNHFGGSQNWGTVDEVRIYNYARTAEQIAYDYNQGKPVAHYKFDEGGGVIAHNEYSQAGSGGAAPVGWWRMDEASSGSANGATIIDQSGYGNNGTADDGANNTGMTWTTGKIGNGALSFDGADDYVIKNPFNNFPSTEVTIEFWMKSSDTTKSGTPFSYGGNNEFLIYNYRNFEIHIAGSSTGATGVSANDGSWHHIAVTWKSSDGSLKLYKDGTQAYSGTLQQGYSIVNGKSLVFAQEQDAEGGGFDPGQAHLGQIDDVRIYNYARSAEQIYNDYKNTHGTLVKGAKFSDGKFGKAIELDGTDDVVIVSDPGANSPLDITSAITLELWVKPDTFTNANGGNYPTPLSKDGDIYRLFFATNGQISFRLAGPTGGDLTSGTNTAPVGSWTHIAATYDSATGLRKIYFNGKEVASRSGDSGNISTSDNPLYIGDAWGQGNRMFDGKIDDVRIYNYARSAEQIMEDYNAGAATHLGAPIAYETDPWGGAPPVAWWMFDENSGAMAYDNSGNGNNGMLKGDAAWAHGKHGSALSFDGTGDYVTISSPSTDIQSLTSYTFEAWLKLPNPGSNYDPIFLKESGSASDIEIYGGNGGITILHNRNNGGTSQYVYANNISANQWVHYAVTYNGGTLKTYINGKNDQTFTGWPDPLTNSYPIDIGRVTSFATHYLSGKIDDVRIYNYARTPAQIAWDYNRGAPVAHWRMDEGAGSTIYDESDNNNDGTLNLGTLGNTVVANAWTTRKNGYCLSFDGADDYIDLGNPTSLQIAGPISISAWILVDDAPANQDTIISRRETSSNWQFAVNTAGKLYFSFWSGGVEVEMVSGTTTISYGTWHHAAITYDMSNIKLYLDGKLDKTEPATATMDTNSTKTLIGRFYTGDGQPFDGKIDDVRIYNYARTAEQVQQDYNEGVAVHLGE